MHIMRNIFQDILRNALNYSRRNVNNHTWSQEGVMMGFSKNKMLVSLAVCFALQGTIGAKPVLTPGVWKDITPAGSNPGTNSTCGLDIDPSNPDVLYAGQLNNGMWKTTNAGETWTQLGNGQMGSPVSGKIDLPSCISVDPKNPLHIYTCHAGWGGTNSNLGFWISTDGGNFWTMTQGFIDATSLPGCGAKDAAKFEVDPNDFNHILISLRYVTDEQFGFFESTDGGATYIHHKPPATWESNTHGIHFLHNDDDPGWTQRSHTWHIDTDGHGWWRTTDSGNSWTQTSTMTGLHGGTHNLYWDATDGSLYAGGTGAGKSTDNGKSWQSISTIPYAYYGVMFGDGKNVYGCSSQGNNGGTVFTSTDKGATWGSPANIGWADQMRLDKIHGIVYMTGFATGVWALKVANLPGTAASPAPYRCSPITISSSPAKAIKMLGAKCLVRSGAAGVFDLKGNAFSK
jgi:hypothetical protein